MAIDTKITHAKKKVKTIETAIEVAERERREKETKIKSKNAELALVAKRLEQLQEEQRKASAAHGFTLDESDLLEYNKL